MPPINEQPAMFLEDGDDLGVLVSRAKSGDAAAIERIIELSLPHLRAYVGVRVKPEFRRREGASDLVQSAAREVLEALPDVEYRNANAFLAWLAHVTWNKVHGKRRFHAARKRDVRREAGGDAAPPDANADGNLGLAHADFETPSTRAQLAEDVQVIERFLRAQDPWDREIVHLARVRSLPWKEVLSELAAQGYPGKLTEGAVKARCQRILAEFQEVVRRHREGPRRS